MTDDPFPAADIGFHQGTPVVPRGFLPTHAAMFGNRLQMPVTRSGRSICGLARHRIRTRWHDDRGFGMTGSDRAVDAVLVVCAIAGERGDGTIDLVEQGTDLRAVIDIIGGQCRGDDPTGAGSCRASRPTIHRRRTVSTQCCPLTDARVRRWTAVASPPVSRPAGSTWNGQ